MEFLICVFAVDSDMCSNFAASFKVYPFKHMFKISISLSVS